MMKLSKFNDKERILKVGRRKKKETSEESSIRLSADFSADTPQARREWNDIVQVLKD